MVWRKTKGTLDCGSSPIISDINALKCGCACLRAPSSSQSSSLGRRWTLKKINRHQPLKHHTSFHCVPEKRERRHCERFRIIITLSASPQVCYEICVIYNRHSTCQTCAFRGGFFFLAKIKRKDKKWFSIVIGILLFFQYLILTLRLYRLRSGD